jgi:ADP-heptose:LPS heptosyltransferase
VHPHRTPNDGNLAKLLVLEFWGLGDLTFSTPLLRAAVSRFEVTLVGKAHARPLLAPTFPGMRFIAYDAPWSAYRGKYDLRKWNWPELLMLVTRLRRERFDAAVSVRNDPRDHLLMRMVGAGRRYGFPRRGSHLFLTHPRRRSRLKQHKVEDWRDLGRALELSGMDAAEPRLEHAQYRTPLGDQLFAEIRKPVLCLHPGARIAVRRWPEPYFEQVIKNLRAEFDFHLILVPDPEGYGSTLVPLADTVLRPLTIRELVDVLGRVDLLLCNDSGPGHLAASCGRPAIPIFGPTDPEWFRPWGDIHHLVIRDICPIRPCFDYCRFPEPYCLTRLSPQEAWPEIGAHIRELIPRGVLPRQLLRGSETPDLARFDRKPANQPSVPVGHLDVAFSVADQNVATTKSIGIYNFSLQLVKHLAVDPRTSKLTVFSNESVSPLPAPTESVEIKQYNYPIRSRGGRIFWDQWGVIQQAHASGREWLFLPKGFCSFAVRPQLRVAAYIHDIMGDFYRRNYPDFWPKVEFEYFARSLAATIRTAEVIFTNTEFTKGEICGLAKRVGLPEPRVVVAGYGFEATEIETLEKQDRVLLFASNMPHKRTDLAIRFLDHWVRQSGFTGQIDCIGIIPPDMPKPPGSHWNWIGRVPPAQGRAMIRSARVVVYVSEQEGFGMPPVEAVLEGTCPVYSGLPPIREVMDDAGCAFSNESEDSFVAAMEQALQVSSETIRGWSAALMSRHNWPAVTRKIVDELAAG